jgi:hypothetical protein
VTPSTALDERAQQIVDVLVDAFADLMAADADALRTRFRTMAADPFARFRGSACLFYADLFYADLFYADLFYADLAQSDDRWCVERTSRAWIRGDLPAENVGTYRGSASAARSSSPTSWTSRTATPGAPGGSPAVRRHLPGRREPGGHRERVGAAAGGDGERAMSMPRCGPIGGFSYGSVTTAKPIRS